MYDLNHYTPHDLAANTIRTLAMDAVQKANSGHPGAPMGLADVAVVLWKQFLSHNPADPSWYNRDRFVLSNGHASMLIYSLLHLSGYDLTLDDIKDFRQWHSNTPGHPENFMTTGVETTTGPLGQGIANAVGMAFAQKWLATQFNRPGYDIINHRIFVIASDGDLMEGISHEVGSMAGHMKLGNLIVLYDDNNITIDGTADLSWSDNVPQRFGAYGWHTLTVDGHDPAGLEQAIATALTVTDKPSLISCKTRIGFGSPNKENTAKSHGSPLGVEEIVLTKEKLGWPTDAHFYVPQEARDYMHPADGASKQAEWDALVADYAQAHPDLYAQFQAILNGDLPNGWDSDIPDFEAGTKIATRAASGQVLGAIAPHIPGMLGGSADLTGSNKTKSSAMQPISPDDFTGRYIYFGIREHGMGSMMNGMALYGLRPYGGTFLIFSDYMRPPMRLAGMMGLPAIYVLTHDSIGLGEDGPTHQPIEQLMGLRMVPNLWVIRPGEATETAAAWRTAVQRKDGPTALVLSRQGLTILDKAETANAAKGGYVLRDADGAQVILMASGSEVEIALEAHAKLVDKGVPARVVSMPCWELFAEQSAEYQASVLPDSITARVAIEAGATLGWERFTGRGGAIIGIDGFGASAPYKTIYEKLGLTADAMVTVAMAQLD